MRSTDGALRQNSASSSTWARFIGLWAVVALISSVIDTGRNSNGLLWMLSSPIWVIRAISDDRTWAQDLLILLAVDKLLVAVTGEWKFPSLKRARLDLVKGNTLIYVQTFSVLGFLVLSSAAMVLRRKHLRQFEARAATGNEESPKPLLPALLVPSRISHSRFFPKKHSFSYSYLYVGVPVGLRGKIGKALSVDTDTLPPGQRGRGWFDVNSRGYLERGSTTSLKEKLSQYLQTQGVMSQDYSFAYLVTAPRFLGYSFNPVSFWYLYDDTQKLKYIILEVNNTFDERRMYLLHAKGASPKHDSDVKLSDSGSDNAKVFTNVWEKDFHVSPFNSRKGSYSLKAIDPLLALQETGQVRIDNTIVLRSSKDHAKLVARVFSEAPAKDAAAIGTLELLRFIAAWWWVGFLTSPRIVKEAWKLYFLQKLQVWYRPEVVETSIGRNMTSEERTLEEFFRQYLTNLVAQSDEALRVVYQPPRGQAENLTIVSPIFEQGDAERATLELRVLTPAFYSRFMHYAHAKEAFDRECFSIDEKNRTLAIGNPAVLSTMFRASRRRQTDTSREIARPQGMLERIRWQLLQWLRCPPATASYPAESALTDGYRMEDIRSLPQSELDGFVRQHCQDRAIYRRIVMKLFLAERYALGFPPLISLLDLILHFVLVVGAFYYLRCWTQNTLDTGRISLWARWDRFFVNILIANAVHLWTFIEA